MFWFFQNPSGTGVVIEPQDSFAWKDNELDEKLKALKAQESSIRPAERFDSTIDKSIGNWTKQLPQAPNQDVVLLKKARGKLHAPFTQVSSIQYPHTINHLKH